MPFPAPVCGPQALRISLRRLKVDASIGVLPHEHKQPQPLLCDVDVWLDQAPPVEDRLSEVLDYRELRETVIRELTARHTNLLETLTEAAARRLCALPRVVAVRLLIDKPGAFADVEAVGVEVFRRRSELP